MVLGQGPDGPVYVLAAPEGDAEESEEAITEPAKVMRIGRMISRLLDEVKDAPLDDASRARLREIYAQSIDELAGGLDEDLAKELRRITTPFAADTTPSDAELRIAQAQLVGWLEGLFQGLQTALVAQHISQRLNDGTRAAIPQSAADAPTPPSSMGTGMYL
ncbi:MAG: bacterial proteasome activator family protein [Propionibacteriaceae bacterium]|nr:bacterial proteasome activator family protein [Propionibacteriaceae bacterium]